MVDSGQHTVSVAGKTVTLTAKEFLLLEYLLQHRGRVLSRDLLLTDVWGYRYTGGTRTVDVHVRRLREKLPLLAKRAGDGEAVRLQAARGSGRAPTRPTAVHALTTTTALCDVSDQALLGAARSRRRSRWWSPACCSPARPRGGPTQQIEQTLTAEARLAGELLARATPASAVAELDAEADRIGELVGARVTFIAADGARGRRFLGNARGRRPDGKPRVAPRGDRGEAARPGQGPPPQRHAQHRHAVRRGAGHPSGHRVRPRGAAAHRHPPAVPLAC